tara:strand:- start:1319 stop:1903 length:585 start_codon:yes stop_codon:yes gene_type:complete
MIDYKEYALEKLSEWILDRIGDEDTTPQEVYQNIIDVVTENRDYFRKNERKSTELLNLMQGKECSESGDISEKYQQGLNDIWKESEFCENVSLSETDDCMPPWGHSDMEALKYTNEISYSEAIAAGWTMTDDGFWIPPQNKEDKVNRWVLPVNEQNGEQFINLPDELLEKVNWKENDTLEWIDNGDGSWTIKKS